MKQPVKRKIQVELTAVWGNGDAESTIKVSRRRWGAIQKGAAHETAAWSWYEGKRSSVVWSFAVGRFSIDGDDCAQHIVGRPVAALFTHIPDR
jgi:hypothetical protein